MTEQNRSIGHQPQRSSTKTTTEFLQEVLAFMRVRRMSDETEKSHLQWVRQVLNFQGNRRRWAVWPFGSFSAI